ncbi:MAG: RNA methyltransferase [Clostridia bacterium]|nr:RNA methyltransferase [Clostridia bacterium]
MVKDITSTENKTYKHLKKLLNRAERYKTGLFIAEGRRIVKDAVSFGAAECIFIEENYKDEDLPLDIPVYRLKNKLFAAVSDTCNSQGIIAVCKMGKHDIKEIKGDTILLSDGVSDPGNMGTLIRTAECSGADAAVILKGSTDPYSPKAVRATMGSIFRIPIYFADILDIKENMQDYSIVATVPDAEESMYDVQFKGKTAVVIGNEGDGISPAMLSQSTLKIRIPMCKEAESLNASVAGGIVLYEIFRQKYNNLRIDK